MPYANVNGLRLFYKVYGQGEALVLVPGLGAGHTAWFRQLPAFRKQYRVVIFDPRSIGRSERPKLPYSFKALADDVIGLMDHLAIRRAHILGQSLGGLVAQEVAIQYPDRVLKLVLVCSTSAEGRTNPTNPALMKALGYDSEAGSINFSRLNTRKTMNAVIGFSFNKAPYRIAMQLLSWLFVRPEMFDGLADQLRAVYGHSTIDRLHLIKAPTLVITGAEDHVVPPGSSEVLASRIPDARLIMIEGGSHAFNVEMASRFNREVLNFLKSA